MALNQHTLSSGATAKLLVIIASWILISAASVLCLVSQFVTPVTHSKKWSWRALKMMFLIKIARTWPAYPRLQTNPDGTCPSPSGILHESLVQVLHFCIIAYTCIYIPSFSAHLSQIETCFFQILTKTACFVLDRPSLQGWMLNRS